MKLAQLGAVSTGVVIVVGVALIAPAFLRDGTGIDPGISVLLSFDVLENGSADANSSWCSGLAALLESRGVKGAVFVSGQAAQASQECASFPQGVDVGSRTFSYVDLTTTDYRIALDEVWTGKVAVDEAGGINSKLFKAPHGLTDENIYSLLSRSGILADFSYGGQYNKYENDRFVKYNLTSFSGDSEQEQFFSLISNQTLVASVAVNFDSSVPLAQIEQFIARLQSLNDGRIHVVSASELTAMSLTIREGDLL